MKLREITSDSFDPTPWQEKGYQLPTFDIKAVREKTYHEPTWLHFGAGNIFRAYLAAVLQGILDSGLYDRGIIVAEGFDHEIIDKVYSPYDNLSLSVLLKSDGSVQKKVIASVTEALKADFKFDKDWKRLVEIFRAPSLQFVSFTVTEKGYSTDPSDFERGDMPLFMMGKLTALLYQRYLAGRYPVTLQSMDNCSHNGDKLHDGVMAYAVRWVESGIAKKGFLDYLNDKSTVSFPWSMIDKITPRPDAKVQKMLQQDGFEDNEIIVTGRNTYTSPFVNAEETEYLVIERDFPCGCLPLDKGGVIFTDRETVDKVERMKVCTCLNPLHTALAIFGCLLDYTLICEQMADEDLNALVTKMGYKEAMPVVTDPKVIDPDEFIEAVLKKRLPNPFMPDAPQRIATDTSQKLSIRFGETIKAYHKQGLDKDELVLIPLVLAAYARYLKAVDDNGKEFVPSPDPLLNELQKCVAGLEIKSEPQDFSCLKELYSRTDVFGVDLYGIGLGERIEGMAAELFCGFGAVRKTLNKYVTLK